MNVFWVKLESACLSVRPSLSVLPSVSVSVCSQNASVYQSAGGGIKSHLVTALVSVWMTLTVGRLSEVHRISQ